MLRRYWITTAFFLLVMAFPVHAASTAAMQPPRRTLPTPCAVFTLDRAVYSYVNCTVYAVYDLNRQRFGWVAFVSVLFLTAMLAGMGDTLPRKTAINAVLLLVAVGLFAAYGYLLTAQII